MSKTMAFICTVMAWGVASFTGYGLKFIFPANSGDWRPVAIQMVLYTLALYVTFTVWRKYRQGGGGGHGP